MSLFNEETRGQLEKIFVGLKDEVQVVLFTNEDDCDSCEETNKFMTEISSMGEKLSLKSYDLKKDKEIAVKYNVDVVPAIVLLDKDGKDNGIKFNGIPAGHEINSFIAGLVEVSGNGESLPKPLQDKLSTLDKKVNIKVFVTLACPHCSGAVSKAHKLALESEFVNAEMIECGTFPELANKYNVSGVPKIVINETEELVGNQPIEQFIEAMLKS